MYAFNRRFRATELFGQPVLAVFSFVFSIAMILLAVFSPMVILKFLFGVIALVLFVISVVVFTLRDDLPFIMSFMANGDERSSIPVGEGKGNE